MHIRLVKNQHQSSLERMFTAINRTKNMNRTVCRSTDAHIHIRDCYECHRSVFLWVEVFGFVQAISTGLVRTFEIHWRGTSKNIAAIEFHRANFWVGSSSFSLSLSLNTSGLAIFMWFCCIDHDNESSFDLLQYNRSWTKRLLCNWYTAISEVGFFPSQIEAC